MYGLVSRRNELVSKINKMAGIVMVTAKTMTPEIFNTEPYHVGHGFLLRCP